MSHGARRARPPRLRNAESRPRIPPPRDADGGGGEAAPVLYHLRARIQAGDTATAEDHAVPAAFSPGTVGPRPTALVGNSASMSAIASPLEATPSPRTHTICELCAHRGVPFGRAPRSTVGLNVASAGRGCTRVVAEPESPLPPVPSGRAQLRVQAAPTYTLRPAAREPHVAPTSALARSPQPSEVRFFRRSR